MIADNAMMTSAHLRYADIINFLALLKPYWKNIFVFIVCGLVLTLLSLPYPWLTKVMIDDVMLRQDISLLYVILVCTFILTVVRSILTALRRYYVSYVQHAMAFDISFLFYRHLQKLSFSFYDSRQVAEVLSRQNDAAQSRRLLIDIITTLINNLLYLTIVPFVVFIMNWKLALIAGFTLPWMAFSFFVLSRFVKRYSQRVAEKNAETSARTFEFISAIREIQALKIEGLILKRIKHIYLQYRKLDMNMRVFGTVEGLISAVMTAIGTLLYTWYGAVLVITGQMTLGELTAFTAFIGYLYTPLTKIFGQLVPIQEVLVHSNRFFEVYDLEPEICDPANPVKLSYIEGWVTFSNVSFGYRGSATVLKDIDLTIPAGSRVAIVGETGCGKTTLMSLLPRFYDPEQGQILIDRIDIRKMSVDDLRSSIGVVRQHPFIFSGTIYDNITCGKKCFSENQVMAAAKAANIHYHINSLKNRYNTKVGENGTTLSGGERQRIALARLFLLNRPIWIMDEVTTGIDRITEKMVHDAIRRLSKGRTTFIIAHRLSTIRDSDLIVVMDNGMIVEKNDYEELMRLKGFFYQLNKKIIKGQPEEK